MENKLKGGENRRVKMGERAVCLYISLFLQLRNGNQSFNVFFPLTSLGTRALYSDIE